MEYTIKNQKEWDALDKSKDDVVYIQGSLEQITETGKLKVKIYGNAMVQYVSGNATVQYVYGNATVQYVSGNATVQSVYGNAVIICDSTYNKKIKHKDKSQIVKRGKAIIKSTIEKWINVNFAKKQGKDLIVYKRVSVDWGFFYIKKHKKKKNTKLYGLLVLLLLIRHGIQKQMNAERVSFMVVLILWPVIYSGKIKTMINT